MATKSYLDEFLDIMREETTNLVFNKQTVTGIKKSIAEWLDIKKRLDRSLFLRYNELQKDNNYKLADSTSIKSSELRKIFDRYTNQKRHIKNIHEIEDMTEHFKKGYELIHRVRESLTKQDITYTILYAGTEDVSGENLLEAHLSLSQILSGVSLALSDINNAKANQELSNATKLNISNSAIKRTIDSLLGSKQNALQQVMNNLDRPNLWNSLIDFRGAKIESGVSKYSANMGRIYEVYSILRRVDKYKSIQFIGHKPGEANTENLANILLQNAIENKDPGWQIGDVGLEQLKAVFNADASLISTSTIEKILRDIENALSISNQAEMAQALKNIFTTQRERFDNKIDELAEKEAIAAIEEAVKNLNLTE